MKIEAEGFETLEVAGDGHLRRVVEFMCPKHGPRFAILSASEEEYIQAAFATDNDLVIECRRGGSGEHFKAVRAADPECEFFSKEEVGDTFAAYWRGEPDAPWLTWQRASP